MKKIEIKYQKEDLDVFVDRMLRSNNISGLINYNSTGYSFDIDIDGLNTVEEIYKGGISYDDLINIFSRIYSIVKELSGYMIDESSINLTMKSVYVDKDKNIYILLLPVIRDNKDIKHFFLEIISNCWLDFSGHEEIIIEILNYFNTGNYSIDGLFNKFFTLFEDCKKDGIINDNTQEIKREERIKVHKDNNNKRMGSLERLKAFFTKKDYKVKSLNIDFKLPKNNS